MAETQRYPNFTKFVPKILCLFGATRVIEEAFSVMKMNKSKMGSLVTHRHLNDIMKIATAQKLFPDIDKLAKAKTCQLSRSSK